jgi:hypothetical protein
MYATDSMDVMLPNSPWGYYTNQSWCPNGGANGGGAAALLDWNFALGNTNTAIYATTILAPYMGNQLGVYRCPADVWPSRNGIRVRDYSMQGQMGNLYCKANTLSMNGSVRAYVKVSDISGAPGPSDLIVFLEENPNSLLAGYPDGYMQVDSTGGSFPDIPGSMHKWSNGMSFADGHSELHRWTTTVLDIVPNSASTVQHTINVGVLNADWRWFTTHCSRP